MENIERGTLFVDYVGLFVPAGVVTGALVAAAVAWWNERKSPLDHLKTLIEIRKDWPPGLKGVETIDYEVGRQLAKLRIAAGAAGYLNADKGMAAVQQARKRRRDTTSRLVFWLALAAVVVGITVYWSSQYPHAADDVRGGWVVMALIITPMVGIVFEVARIIQDARRKKAARAELNRASAEFDKTLARRDRARGDIQNDTPGRLG